MIVKLRWKTGLLAAVSAFMHFGFLPSSHAIPHDGEILNCRNCGGVGFSWFHRAESTPIGGGGFMAKILEGTPIAYEWLPAGPVGATSKQIFNRGSTRILDNVVLDGADNEIIFSIDLWVDHANNVTGTDAGDLNVLAVRPGPQPASMTVTAGQDATDYTLTHKVSARFGFTITTADAVIFDEFIFDSEHDMGSVDKIGNDADSGVGTFLWGYTSGHNALNFFDSNTSSTVCLEGEEAACHSIVDALYGARGVGLDLAYSGTGVSVSEPGIIGLLAVGLVGIGLNRRRRRI
jgi:hypothetical protein